MTRIALGWIGPSMGIEAEENFEVLEKVSLC